MLQVTELVNSEGVETWLQTFEFSNHGNEITMLLSQSDAAFGLSVSEEIELTGGSDSLFGRLEVEVVVVDRCGIMSTNEGRALSANAFPSAARMRSTISTRWLMNWSVITLGLMIITLRLMEIMLGGMDIT